MKYLFILFITLVSFTSCTKEAARESICLEGTIEWEGYPAADGLGWVLRTNTESPQAYVLNDVPEDYQQDGLAVQACIIKNGERKLNCMCSQPLDTYDINSIRKL